MQFGKFNFGKTNKANRTGNTGSTGGSGVKKMFAAFEGMTGEMLQRALMSFDRATIMIVVSIWSAALVMVIVALYTLSLASRAHGDMKAALAAEPTLPKLERSDLSQEDARKLIDRLKKRYDGLEFGANKDGTITVNAVSPDSFNTWMAALSYFDTITPDVRWSLTNMCVGSDCNRMLMSASVGGQRLTFNLTAPGSK